MAKHNIYITTYLVVLVLGVTASVLSTTPKRKD